ncbi:MAG: DUF4157 domain-containing protein, partial [Pseudomonadota bacterium]
MGADFGAVRIHDDAAAAERASRLGAQAYTQGCDIVFNKGRYDPESSRGKHLLAHELAHVVQQRASGEAVPMRKIGDGLRAWNENRRRKKIDKTIDKLADIGTEATGLGAKMTKGRFDSLMAKTLRLSVSRAKLIAKHFVSDAALGERFRQSCRSAFSQLVSAWALATGYDPVDIWAENSGRIPMWAWPEPHEAHQGVSTPIAQSQAFDPVGKTAQGQIKGVDIEILPDIKDPNVKDAEGHTESKLVWEVKTQATNGNVWEAKVFMTLTL